MTQTASYTYWRYKTGLIYRTWGEPFQVDGMIGERCEFMDEYGWCRSAMPWTGANAEVVGESFVERMRAARRRNGIPV